ncbi:MAG: hypothetical protein WCB27_06825 [Thermoguttaceae bacterium]
MSARKKLNCLNIVGAITVAAIVGGLIGSWLVFFMAVTLLIGGAIYAGDIRTDSRPRR